MRTNNFILFFALYVLTFSTSIFSRELMGVDQLIYNSLAERLTGDQIKSVLQQSQRWQWVGYVAMPLLLYIKVLLISTALFMGIFLSERKLQFKYVLNIVLKAEFVFLLALCFKTIKFYFFDKGYSLTDLGNYMPLSLESLFGYKNFEAWYIYPMQIVNLFEVAYWFVLVVLLSKALRLSKSKALSIVAGSYGAGLLIWVVGIVFITLSLSK